MNEADTCRTYILPKLKDAHWEEDAILEQVILTLARRTAAAGGVIGWVAGASVPTARSERGEREEAVRADVEYFG
jgi:hypothetical protein